MSGLTHLILGRPKATKIAGFQVQTASYGRPVPIVYGKARIAGNLVHMPSQPVLQNSNQSKATRATKGAASGEIYMAPIILALSEGPIPGLGWVWRDKDAKVDFAAYNSEGWAFFPGDLTPSFFTWLQTNYPAQAVSYQLTAYVANITAPMPSGSLSQYSWEVKGFLPFEGFGLGQIADALPPDIIDDFLTNGQYGAGWSSAQIASLTTAQDYCAAAGLFISPAIDEQKPAADWVNELCETGNLALVWSDGKLKFIPYGDVPLSGNGHTYTPNTTPLYDLTDSHFLPRGDLDPIQVTRTDPATAINQVTVEYRDRDHDYNVATYTAQDQYAIQQYGVIPLTLTLHAITTGAVAQQVAQLRLQREQNVRNTYSFRLGWRFSLLESMDLVTVTDVGLGLSLTPVRITAITEGTDEAGFDVVAEEWPFGTASATLYGIPNPTGSQPNANVDPGNTATPIITEAPAALKTSPLDLLIAAHGGADWGGCDVWISTDNTNFTKVGRIVGAAAAGTLTATLNTSASVYPATDSVNTCSVNIAASGRTLPSYSATDFANLVPSCYVGGEWIAFETATLTSLGHYDLTTLYRALYGTAVGSHASSTAFFLLDGAVGRIPWPQGKSGETIYFKFPAFNIYGAQLQDVASVSSVSYVIANDPTQFQNATPQGTVSIDSNGTWSFTSDGPSNAVNAKYQASTSSYPADATVAASGTVCASGSRFAQVTNGGTLTFGQTIFITIVWFDANGRQLLSTHIRGSYQSFTATKTANYSSAAWSPVGWDYAAGAPCDYHYLNVDEIVEQFLGTSDIEPLGNTQTWKFNCLFPQAPGCTLTNVTVEGLLTDSTGNGYLEFDLFVAGGSLLGSYVASNIGSQSMPVNCSSSTSGTPYIMYAILGIYASGGPFTAGQFYPTDPACDVRVGGFTVTWSMPDPKQTL